MLREPIFEKICTTNVKLCSQTNLLWLSEHFGSPEIRFESFTPRKEIRFESFAPSKKLDLKVLLQEKKLDLKVLL